MSFGHLRIVLSFMMVTAAFCALVFMPSDALANKKYASIVMDADTGMILHQRHANKSLHPASLTKVMTLLMTFEAMERGDITLNSRVRVSKRAASMVPSKIGLAAGQTIRVEDAIYALVTKSANDIAVALAEHLAGSEYNFAKKMTRRARQLGMQRTSFRNASGLHHKYQVSTARDMAIMARYVINRYPSYYRYFSKKKFKYRGKTYRNHNKLLSSYKGMDGMKTGYINASGFNLVASAVRNNRRVVAVVFGGRTSKSRNAHMAKLLDRGFSKLNTIYIARSNAPRPDRKPLHALAAANVETISEQFATIESAAGNPAYNVAAIQQNLENPAAQSSNFGEYAGQGDLDPEFSSRIETGLAAVHAHQNKNRNGSAYIHQASYRPDNKVSAQRSTGRSADGWSIQIGAYSTRLKTGQAIRKAQEILPPAYARATADISPFKIGERYIFRARLAGYTKAEAVKACTYFKDCMTIGP